MSHETHEESWIYQEIVEKGIIQILKEGTKQGMEQDSQQGLEQGIRPEEEIALQSVILNLIKACFPTLAQPQFTIPAEASTLKTILQKLFKAQTEEEAGQILSGGTSPTESQVS